MASEKTKLKFLEWLKRYFVAEMLGTLIAVCFASLSFAHSHSYILAAGAGFIGEGIGFYGYFAISELTTHSKTYRGLPWFNRIRKIIATSGTNLIIEFAPAELIDNIFIRPFLMYFVPQHLKPYALGFIAGKLLADAVFYLFAITGYEIKKRIRR